MWFLPLCWNRFFSTRFLTERYILISFHVFNIDYLSGTPDHKASRTVNYLFNGAFTCHALIDRGGVCAPETRLEEQQLAWDCAY
jgi:hypothetical protein